MSTVRDVMDHLVTILEGVVPPTVYARTRAYRHADRIHAEALDGLTSPTRFFVVSLTGDREYVGPMGSGGSPTEVRQTFDIEIAYALGAQPWEVSRVIAEDMDVVGWAFVRAWNWSHKPDGQLVDTGISGIEIGKYTPGTPGESPDRVLVTLPVAVTYWPTVQG